MYIRMSNGYYSRRFHMGYPIFIPLRLRYHLCQRVHLFAIIISPFRHYHITFASFSYCSFPTITSHRKIIVFICAFKFFFIYVTRITYTPDTTYSVFNRSHINHLRYHVCLRYHMGLVIPCDSFIAFIVTWLFVIICASLTMCVPMLPPFLL